MTDERALVGVVVMFAIFAVAAIYLMVAAPLLDGLGSSPVVQDPSFSDPDAMIDGSVMWSNVKTVALVGIPLILIATGVVYAIAYYTRRERSGARAPRGRL